MIKLIGNEKGFAMITAYLLLAAVATLAFAMLARGNVFVRSSEQNQNRILAFHNAEAGVDAALKQVANDPTFTGSEYTPLNTSSTTGGYSVAVTTPVDNPDIRIIQATGYSPGNDSDERAYAERTTTVYAQVTEQGAFQSGIFANGNISLTGNAYTDSYNSNDGAYSAGTAGDNGSIQTNSTSNSTVSLTGNAVVNGDVIIGPSGNTATAISTTGNAEINGTPGAASATQTYEVQTTGTSSSGALSISGSRTTNLSAGTYRYSSISISGNGRLNVNGAVTIYVDGNISIGGNGITNTTSLPPNCVIYSAGTSVSISGNGNFYGAIHAPDAAVSNTGNGNIYGAVIADTYTQTGNGAIHYDEALQEVGSSGNNEVSLLAWKENATSA